MKNCGTCNMFILENDDYFIDRGECKDRATVYMDSEACSFYKRDKYYNIIMTQLKYHLAYVKKERE